MSLIKAAFLIERGFFDSELVWLIAANLQQIMAGVKLFTLSSERLGFVRNF